jgi:hypothetical protein
MEELTSPGRMSKSACPSWELNIGSLRPITQTNGQAETLNRQLKSILNKTIEKGGKDWSKKLDGDLWAYRTVFKTLIGMTPYQFVYGKACHLPVELEQKAYLAIKEMNLDLGAAVVK